MDTFPLGKVTGSVTAAACLALPGGEPVAVFAGHSGPVVVCRLDDRRVLFELTGHDGRHRRTLAGSSTEAGATVVRLPSGATLAAAGSFAEKVRLWDVGAGTQAGDLGVEAGLVAGVTLPDRAVVVAAEADEVTVHTLV